MEKTTIRKGMKEDVPEVFRMIRELAEYEKAPEEVNVTKEILLKDGFKKDPPDFHLLVAEGTGGIMGMAFYYFGYSTWKGKMLYLDDLVVKEEFRRAGIGEKLFHSLVEEARKEKAHQIRWHVLDWNEPAINFYRKINADLDPEWITGKMEYSDIYGE